MDKLLASPSTLESSKARIEEEKKDGLERSEHLALSLEGPAGLGDTYGQLFQGWFVPPATTRYRFYMACDDFCKLSLASTPDNSSLDALEVLLDEDKWSARDMKYWKNDSETRVSAWKSLKKGEHYHIAATHGQYGGGEHMAVAVEIE